MSVGDVVYSAALELITNSNSIDFTVTSSTVMTDTGRRSSASDLSGNILSIPVLRPGHIFYLSWGYFRVA